MVVYSLAKAAAVLAKWSPSPVLLEPPTLGRMIADVRPPHSSSRRRDPACRRRLRRLSGPRRRALHDRGGGDGGQDRALSSHLPQGRRALDPARARLARGAVERAPGPDAPPRGTPARS